MLITKKKAALAGIIFSFMFQFYGCTTTNKPDQPKEQIQPPPPAKINCSITIDSTPRGALVLGSFDGNEFSETNAFIIGNTPLRRYMEIPETGMHVLLSLYRHEAWQGRVTPANPTVSPELIPILSKQPENNTATTGIIVVPARVGSRLIGDESGEFETDEAANTYRNRFLDVFSKTLADQGVHAPIMKDIADNSCQNIWNQFESAIKDHCFERVPYMPERLSLDLSVEEKELLTREDKYILLLRAEAYHLGQGKRFAKVAVPLLMTVAGAAISINNPIFSTSTTTTYAYPVFGLTPDQDQIVIQAALLNPNALKVEWCGQILASTYYRKEKEVNALAEQTAKLIPDQYLKD